MSFFLKYFLILILILNVSCKSNKPEDLSVISEKEIDLQMIDSYKEGLEFLEKGDGLSASNKFNEAEMLYPQSIWASRSSLMSAYSYFYGSYYVDAIEELNRFIEIYPNHKRIPYAYYLLGMCHYEQIADERKDIGSIIYALGPSMKVLSPELIFPIVPPLCWALYQFFTKLISGNNEPFSAVFYTAVTGALIFTIYISFNWVPIENNIY